ERRLIRCQAWIREDARAEESLEVPGIGRGLEPGEDVRGRGVHFQRIVERTLALLLEGIGAPVPEEPSLRNLIGRGGLWPLRRLQCPRVPESLQRLLRERGRLVI